MGGGGDPVLAHLGLPHSPCRWAGTAGKPPELAVCVFPRAVVTKTCKPSCLKEQYFWDLEVQDEEVNRPASRRLRGNPSLLLPCFPWWLETFGAPLQLCCSSLCFLRPEVFSLHACLHVAIFSRAPVRLGWGTCSIRMTSS